METNLIKEIGEYSLLRDIYSDKFYITKETSEPKNELIEKRFFKVYLNGTNNSEKNMNYEILEFLDSASEFFALSLFNFIVDLNQTIKNSIDEIETFLSSDKKIDLLFARGVFAELIAYNERNLEIVHSNAIYDFREDGIDLEIKSVSKNQSSIQISSQQATNNPNAKIVCMEVIETSEGMSVKEVLKDFNINHERYDWLKASTSRFLDIKFDISRTTEFITGDVFKNLYLPEDVLYAKFVVKVKFEK